MSDTLFAALTAAAGQCKSASGAVLTKEFLDTCSLILPVVDQMGTGLAIVKGDIKGNIDRLSEKASTNPAKFTDIWAIVEEEVASGQHTGKYSCTKGLLWLKRAMEFMVAIISNLQSDPAATMYSAVSEAYGATLKKFHGYLVYGTFTVALNLVPSKASFFAAAGGGLPDDALHSQMKEFVDAFSPVLAALQQQFAASNLDDPTPV